MQVVITTRPYLLHHLVLQIRSEYGCRLLAEGRCAHLDRFPLVTVRMLRDIHNSTKHHTTRPIVLHTNSKRLAELSLI